MLTHTPRTAADLPARPLLLVLALLCLLATLPAQRLSLVPTLTTPSVPEAPQGASQLAQLPLAFVPNVGQSDSSVHFQARALGGSLFFTPGAVVLSLPASNRQPLTVGRFQSDRHVQPPLMTDPPAVVQLHFDGANPSPNLAGTDRLPGIVNYFIGNDPARWRTNLPTYAGVTYQQLYPGIDLRYDGNDGRLKGTYLVAPGADPARIRWRYTGATDVRIDATTGDLTITLPRQAGVTARTLIERAPVAWQEINGHQVSVAASYQYAADGSIGFALDHYDPRVSLTIDPILQYSTYLGGNGFEYGSGIAVDNAGNIYVTGNTDSLTFPAFNPLQPPARGTGIDVFVAKLDPSGKKMIFSTYIGGNDHELPSRIAVDSGGNMYVTGYTSSRDFPSIATLQGYGGGVDAFVVKIDTSGTKLLLSTYLGGTQDDYGWGLTLDNKGGVYLVGETASTDFLTAMNTLPPFSGGGDDPFVMKLNATGGAPIFNMRLGGSGNDGATSIVVDSTGNMYITGQTTSGNFYTTPSSYQGSQQGSDDAFVVKLDPNGSSLLYSTYLGGTGSDLGSSIAIDNIGNAYISGQTTSPFPQVNSIQASFGGNGSLNYGDAFVAKLNPQGNALLFSTYLGGDGDDGGTDIAVDDSGNVYITGTTNSAANYPIINPLQAHLSGPTDMFVAKIDTNTHKLLVSTYLGGSNDDQGNGIALDNLGNAYIVGATDSSDFRAELPFQPSLNGSDDALIVKVSTVPSLDLNAQISDMGGNPIISMDPCPVSGSCPPIRYTFTLSTTDSPVQASLVITVPNGLELPSNADPESRRIAYNNVTVFPDSPMTFSYQTQLLGSVSAGAVLLTNSIASGTSSQYGAIKPISRSVPLAIRDNTFQGSLVMIYASGDNNLSGEMADMFAKAELGSTNTMSVTTLLLLDGPSDDDTYLYRLQPPGTGVPCNKPYVDPSCGGRYQEYLNRWHWKGDSLGDYHTLTTFLVAAESTYPKASVRVLSLVGHGGGWSPPVPGGQPSGHGGQPSSDPLGGMLWDTHPDPGSALSTPALGTALSDAIETLDSNHATDTPPQLDLLFLDACDMSMAVVAYEVRVSS
jgi:hypothetical protein